MLAAAITKVEPLQASAWQCFLGGVEGWVTYNDKLSEDFERAFLCGTSSLQFSLGPFFYELNFITLMQTNISTGKKRQVRRVKEVAADIYDKEGSEGMLLFPFADGSKNRLPIFWEPERKELCFSGAIHISRREGFQRDCYFWDDKLPACTFEGR